MRRWLSGEYTVEIFESHGAPVAYVVWRGDDDGVYVRQFFVVRDQRRSGIGRQAFAQLEGNHSAGSTTGGTGSGRSRGG